MRRVRFATIVVAALTLAACSRTEAPQPLVPAFEIHAMKGSFHYLGGEIALQSAPARATVLTMPIEVRSVALPQHSPLAVEPDGRMLMVSAPHGLPAAGAAMTVKHVDGRTVPFRMFSAPPSNAAAALGDDARARLAFPLPVAAESEFSRLKRLARRYARGELRGFVRDRSVDGLPAIDTPALLAVQTERITFHGLSFLVATVHNRSDRPLQLSPAMFHLRHLRAVYFEREQLAPRTDGTFTVRSDSETRAYIAIGS